ncbi:transposase [Streptomyces sp. AC550_RSS872]|uniref:transposase n=1 Tax=Streptomyces sp. AC550_RSS872 TaxID=2823689 RepID=UPI0035ABD2DE
MEADAGTHDLIFLDESGFAPTMPTGYTWSRIGQRAVVPREYKSDRRINVLGALVVGTGPDLFWEYTPGKIDAKVLLEFVCCRLAGGPARWPWPRTVSAPNCPSGGAPGRARWCWTTPPRTWTRRSRTAATSWRGSEWSYSTCRPAATSSTAGRHVTPCTTLLSSGSSWPGRVSRSPHASPPHRPRKPSRPRGDHGHEGCE